MTNNDTEETDESEELTELQLVENPTETFRLALVHSDELNLVNTAEKVGQKWYDIVHELDMAIIFMPEWWVSEKAAVWTNVVVGHIDKETERAYHMTKGYVYSGEVSKWLDEVDENEEKPISYPKEFITRGERPDMKNVWIPKSLVKLGLKGEHTLPKLGILLEPDGDGGSKTFGRTTDGDYIIRDAVERTIEKENGETFNAYKLLIDFEYDEELIKHLKKASWQETHRRFSDELSCWTVDLDAAKHIIEHILEGGYSVVIREEEGLNPYYPERNLWFSLDEYTDKY